MTATGAPALTGQDGLPRRPNARLWHSRLNKAEPAQAKHSNCRHVVLASGLLGLAIGAAQAATDLGMESAHTVNEGVLHFLEKPPAKPVHHHQNHIRIDDSSLRSGWVKLSQCHEHLDPVPRAQITFREGFVRDLKVISSARIKRAWVEGSGVQLVNIEPGARLCLSAQTRTLKDMGNGYFTLCNGPYMRKFLDGYYPMHVSMRLEYPPDTLQILDLSPAEQKGFSVRHARGRATIDGVFEGELYTLVQFERR